MLTAHASPYNIPSPSANHREMHCQFGPFHLHVDRPIAQSEVLFAQTAHCVSPMFQQMNTRSSMSASSLGPKEPSVYVAAGALVLGGLATRGVVRIALRTPPGCFPSSATVPFYISCAYQGGIVMGNRIEMAISGEVLSSRDHVPPTSLDEHHTRQTGNFKCMRAIIASIDH